MALPRLTPESTAARRAVVLGPQPARVAFAEVLQELALPPGPVASITVGWRETEPVRREVDREIGRAGREAIPLHIGERVGRVFAEDPELSAAHRLFQNETRAEERLYRARLRQAERALRAEARIATPGRWRDAYLGRARREVLAADRFHLDNHRSIAAEFRTRMRLHERPAVARQIGEITALLDRAAAVVLTGGHVAVIRNRLFLLDIAAALTRLPILAWSAGAMVLSRLIVCFDDRGMSRRRPAEMFGAGVDVLPELVFFPDAALRLDFEGREELRRLAERIRPSRAVLVDRGERLDWDGKQWTARDGLRLLSPDGVVERVACWPGPGSRAADLPPRRAARRPVPADPGDAGPESGEPDADPGAAPHVPAFGGLAVRELELSRPTPEAVDRFLADRQFPIREGPHTTFVYRGEADSVLLGHWLFGTSAAREMERLPDSDFWFVTIDLPAESRIEYRLRPIRDGSAEWILDPLNPRTVHDPFGEWSVCHGVGYERPGWTREHASVARGALHSLEVRSAALGRRPVTVYTPVGFRGTRHYPLLVVHDGRDYLRHAAMRTVLDNLIHRRDIPPLIAVFIDPGKRILEYTNSEAHAAFLTGDLLPALREAGYTIRPGPDDRALVGAGLGAVAALTGAWRRPGFFGKLLLQSGSFIFTDTGPNTRTRLLDPVVEFVDGFRKKPTPVGSRVFVSCGAYEPLVYESRSLVPLLRKSGMEVRYVESPDGHNWESWRDRLREGLSWLFPGPIWLYYR